MSVCATVGVLGVDRHIVYSIYTILTTTTKFMGYRIKVQKVQRPTNRSYYVNLPVVLAEAISLQKGEAWEWSMEDKNTLILSRVKKAGRRRKAANA